MKKAVSIFFLIFLLQSCVSVKKIETGVIATEGVTISAIDGSFVLYSGKRFKTPFSDGKLFIREEQGDPIIPKVDKLLSGKGKYKNAVYKKVKIKTPYSNEELYGVLYFSDYLFDKVFAESTDAGAVTQSYQISIPESCVKDAIRGKLSFVYEYYTERRGYRQTTWILWISNSPF